MRLWDWATIAYEARDSEGALLALQDEAGQCVGYLLWAAWAVRAGRAPSAADLALAADLARRWEAEVTGPLRAARRALKPVWPDLADAAREALRQDVKSAELEAERVLLQALEAITAAAERGRGDLRDGAVGRRGGLGAGKAAATRPRSIDWGGFSKASRSDSLSPRRSRAERHSKSVA